MTSCIPRPGPTQSLQPSQTDQIAYSKRTLRNRLDTLGELSDLAQELGLR